MNRYHSRTIARLIILLFAVLNLLQACSPVQKMVEPKKENGLLWEIRSAGIKEPSYLYGTIHMICAADFSMSDTITKAFGKSRQLYLELDMDDPTMAMKTMKLSMMKDKTLKDIFTPADYARLEKYLKDNFGMPMMLFNQLKPIAITSLLAAKQLPCEKMESYEQHFQDMAKARNMELKGLETLEYQFGVFDRIPDSAQARMIMYMIDQSSEQKADFEKMLSAYKKRDLVALGEQLNDAPDIVGYEDILLRDRNQNWIPVMESAMSEMPSFFAVGAGHLAGKEGLIALLKKNGYRLKALY